MSESDTPRTDEAFLDIYAFCKEDMIPAIEFARQLERELTAARRLAEKYRNLSCDSQDEADETLLPWETTNPNEQ